MTYCLVCRGTSISEVVKENHRYYFCSTCKRLYERAYTTRFGRDKAINTKYGIQHTSVGAMILRGNTCLMVKRRSYPFGFDFPAGHVEYGESPEQALDREVMEETGLKVSNRSLIYEGEMKGNRCKYGADSHYWYFYMGECLLGSTIISSESESIGWYTKEELHQLDLIPSARFFLKQLDIKIS